MRRLSERPVMSGRIDDHGSSFFFSISFSFAHTPFSGSIHHHAAHLHRLKNDPDSRRVKYESKNCPGRYHSQRPSELETKAGGQPPTDIESEKQPQPQH